VTTTRDGRGVAQARATRLRSVALDFCRLLEAVALLQLKSQVTPYFALVRVFRHFVQMQI
jgi:hypothetical protein